MSKRWEAPQTAYGLAADWAERAAEMVARSGGARDLPPIGAPGMGKGWDDLRTIERLDVLRALADQARAAMWEMRRHAGVGPDETIYICDTSYTGRMCELAADAFTAILDPGGAIGWKMPECSHCAALVAEALVNVQVGALLATGVADPAAVLRTLAEGMKLPEPREAADGRRH